MKPEQIIAVVEEAMKQFNVPKSVQHKVLAVFWEEAERIESEKSPATLKPHHRYAPKILKRT